MSKIDKVLYNNFKWSDIRKIGNSKVIKSSVFWIIFVPIFVKSIEFGESKFLIFTNYKIYFHPELPFSWTLFYFSAVAFSIGTFLYTIFCPNFIKDFKNYTDYKEQGNITSRLETELIDFIHWVNSWPERIGAFYPEIANLLKKDNGQPNDNSLFQVELNDLIVVKKPVESFWSIRELISKKNKYIRLSTFFFFTIGFILIGVVFIQNFLIVLEYINK
ncbi:MAG: hypothetical protein GXO79_10215 [Chlorobi bacterium]|nr:hypothetical protein [Chlorobiota bacterium]